MDDLDQLARDTLVPGVGVRLRAANGVGNACYIDTDKGAAGVREWMVDAKLQHGETDFVMEAVDKDDVVIRALWSGSV